MSAVVPKSSNLSIERDWAGVLRLGSQPPWPTHSAGSIPRCLLVQVRSVQRFSVATSDRPLSFSPYQPGFVPCIIPLVATYPFVLRPQGWKSRLSTLHLGVPGSSLLTSLSGSFSTPSGSGSWRDAFLDRAASSASPTSAAPKPHQWNHCPHRQACPHTH